MNLRAIASERNFHWLLLASALLVIVCSFNKYWLQEDYTFLVEGTCDPRESVCYSRDCSNADDCPPNGFSTYKVYSLPATHFSSCSDNACTNLCNDTDPMCVEIPCITQSEVACVPEEAL